MLRPKLFGETVVGVPFSEMTKRFVFRIRKEYFDQIIAGKKKVEYRRDSPFWEKRVVPKNIAEKSDKPFLMAMPVSENFIAVFICGKRMHRREITLIEKIETPSYFSEQGNKDVDTPLCFVFHLGKEISP